MAYLDQVGMADFANRQISQLSGGQQQRVFLAGAAQKPIVISWTNPLPVSMRQRKKPSLKYCARWDQGRTVFSGAPRLADRARIFDSVVLLNMRVVAAGSIESTFTEDNLRKTYGGKLTLLDQATDLMARPSASGIQHKTRA